MSGPGRPPPRRDIRGRSRGGPVRIADLLGEAAGRLGAGRADVVGVVFGQWDDIVGPAVAAHVRPVRMEGEALIVHADHPAWATQIRHLAPDILSRLSTACGPTWAPRRLDVRVRR